MTVEVLALVWRLGWQVSLLFLLWQLADGGGGGAAAGAGAVVVVVVGC